MSKYIALLIAAMLTNWASAETWMIEGYSTGGTVPVGTFITGIVTIADAGAVNFSASYQVPAAISPPQVTGPLVFSEELNVGGQRMNMNAQTTYFGESYTIDKIGPVVNASAIQSLGGGVGVYAVMSFISDLTTGSVGTGYYGTGVTRGGVAFNITKAVACP